jgi:3-hydroxyisobutyrate dehydrogenase-like beta-hydroxyacid dehydrogenase
MSALPSTPAPAAPVVDPLPLGFVGLGQMGQPIALRLAAAGQPFFVTTRTRARAEPLLAAGAVWCDSPAEVAKRVGKGLLFVMLPEAKDTRRVLSGRRGILRRAAPGLLVVDLSTVAPEESRATAALLAEHQIAYVDCPVGGSVDAAEGGRLLVFAGGSGPDLDRAEPYLLRFGQRVERMGPIGSGAAAKLTNNLLTISHIALLGEALAFGQALGLERGKLLGVLAGGGGRSVMLDAKREMIERGEFPAKFRLSLALKDAKLIEKAGRASGRNFLFAPAVRKSYALAAHEGHAAEDFAAVVLTSGAKPSAPPTPLAPDPPA